MKMTLILLGVFCGSVVFAQKNISDEMLTIKACSSFLKSGEFQNQSLDLISDVSIHDSGKSKIVSLSIIGVNIVDPVSKRVIKVNCSIDGYYSYDGTETQCDQCNGKANCACEYSACLDSQGKSVK